MLRQLHLMEGEKKLRAALPDTAALSTTLLYPAADYREGEWQVRVRIWSGEGWQSIELVEPLSEFPSPTLVAQAMLVT
jgi:hypothetical protein